MRVVVVRIPLVMAACLALLAGCGTMPRFGEQASTSGDQASPPSAQASTSGEPAAPAGADAYAATTPVAATQPTEAPAGAATAPGLLGSDANDDLSLGKKHFLASNYGLAEQYFRRAVETHPKDGEAWIGLAAANDRLQRFDLADRAYKEATRILGPTPELLNNQGYSYILRGNYGRARQMLRKAQARDPNNPYIRNNLVLLDKVARKGKSVD